MQHHDIAHLRSKQWPLWKSAPRFEVTYRWHDFMFSLISSLTRGSSDCPELSRLFSDVPAFFARTGRECLYLALKVLNLRPQSTVGVPLFCCRCVFESIAAAGHRPQFLDIDPTTFSVDVKDVERHKDELDAVIVVHTFGYPADLNRIRTVLAGKNVFIIEDCAHSLFSEYRGQLTGRWGDVSILSFGLRKPAAAGGGGLLIINNDELAAPAKRWCDNLPVSSLWQEYAHCLWNLSRSLAYHRCLYGAYLALPFVGLRDGCPETNHSAPDSFKWQPHAIRSVDLSRVALAIRNFELQIPSLRKNSDSYRSYLKEAISLPEEPTYGTWNHFWTPVQFPNAAQSFSARRYLAKRQIDLPLIWPRCVQDAYRLGYRGGCKQAETAAETVCRIPNFASLSESDVQYVSEAVRASLTR